MSDKIIIDGRIECINKYRDEMLSNLYAYRSEAIFEQIDSNFDVQENAKKIRAKSHKLEDLIDKIQDAELKESILKLYTEIVEERNDEDCHYYRGFYYAGIKDGIKMF